MKALIVGNGLIGSEVSRQLNEHGHETSFFTSKCDRNTYKSRAKRTDVVFLAISTRDDGRIAADYILDSLEQRVPVVTSEKGSLAYYFDELHPHLNRIGYAATVGGGSGMLNIFKSPHYKIKEIYSVVNGTLNFLFSGGTVSEALRLGLCEPGSTDLVPIVHSELRDVMLKLAILFNISGVSEQPIAPSDFSHTFYSEYEIKRMMSAGDYRYVVIISHSKNKKTNFGIWTRSGEWSIRGEFVIKSRLPFPPTSREINTLYILDQTGLETTVFGCGAGPRCTAAVMIADAVQLV